MYCYEKEYNEDIKIYICSYYGCNRGDEQYFCS